MLVRSAVAWGGLGAVVNDLATFGRGEERRIRRGELVDGFRHCGICESGAVARKLFLKSYLQINLQTKRYTKFSALSGED